MSGIIDEQGFRLNVGIIIVNRQRQVLLARRHKNFSWQFPQGGMDGDETEEQTLYRELQEEVGLQSCDIKIICKSERWYSYKLPEKFIRSAVPGKRQCIGQKQKWFLVRLTGHEKNICLDSHDAPEFSEWSWFDPKCSVDETIHFKREVYRQVLEEFTAHL